MNLVVTNNYELLLIIFLSYSIFSPQTQLKGRLAAGLMMSCYMCFVRQSSNRISAPKNWPSWLLQRWLLIIHLFVTNSKTSQVSVAFPYPPQFASSLGRIPEIRTMNHHIGSEDSLMVKLPPPHPPGRVWIRDIHTPFERSIVKWLEW